MTKKNILIITNCQGRKLVSQFLCCGSAELAGGLNLMEFPQAQLITKDHRESFRDRFAAADIILAQPLFGSPLEELRPGNLTSAARDAGKLLITFPSLRFTSISYSLVGVKWRDYPLHPFEGSEDTVIAALFAAGLSPSEAARLYHEVPLASEEALLENVKSDIIGLRERERRAKLNVGMSDFYEQNWRKSRLHYTNEHPYGSVYVEVATRLAPYFGVTDFQQDLVRDVVGNNFTSLPIKRWVAKNLKLEFEDDPDLALSENKELPFISMLERFWDFYGKVGRAEVIQRLNSENSFREALKAFNNISGSTALSDQRPKPRRWWPFQ
jgi:hypothetical protein